jgi:transcriptional regulator with XRE-family HTH domain
MTLETAFGAVLRELRLRRGLSQEKLGFECGYHRTYISLLERGVHSPTINTVFILARVLRTTPSAIIKKVESKAPTVERR